MVWLARPADDANNSRASYRWPRNVEKGVTNRSGDYIAQIKMHAPTYALVEMLNL